jgi:hypothetical protein
MWIATNENFGILDRMYYPDPVQSDSLYVQFPWLMNFYENIGCTYYLWASDYYVGDS